ncbi:hypothetical protein PMZ80_008424 [Knufia obscura]|uniref:Uncharacterized protein n=2 Tax=Knufia TaxID=430999 RepID=A0AAN8EBC4_9EURO|nr:hypothetical protein PMZ80_008424 [Knufia obscura]KAK5951309.1 hypothetical protein OHC33_007727 [Knufia fluminis]
MQVMRLFNRFAPSLLLWCFVILASAHEWVGASLKHDYSRYLTHEEGKPPLADADLEGFFASPPQWKVKTSQEHQGHVDYGRLNKTLLPLTFEPLALGTIKPRGWFRQQLELMADGLPGHMHEFYRLVRNATWGGGSEEYSILNEAWPYYINGLVPLAFAVDDRHLLNEINQQISYVLLTQFPDGWLGPESDVTTRNFWGRYPFFLAAAQYVEAADSYGSREMLKAMHRFVDLMHEMLLDDYAGYVWRQGDRFDEQWGRSRASDMVLALQWLYENHPEDNHVKIHQCMFMIYEKAYDWSWWFSDGVFLKRDIETYPPELINPLFPVLHAVNAGQGLKSPAVMGRLLRDQSLLDSSRRGVELTFEYHGTSSGAIVGDERMSGNSPARGTELCSVVETMFSLSTLYQILGDASFAERLENAAFNAMPAMIMPRWWAHQYVAQTNQPYSYEVPNTHFWNVGPWGLTFGTEPNYPCCTVNFPQGYPKLLSNSWVRTPKHNGLAHVVLLPSDVKTTLRRKEGEDVFENYVHIRCETNYPFTQLLTYHVEAQDTFNFSFRVPEWVDLNNPETGIYLNKDDMASSNPATAAQQPLRSSKQDPQPLKPDQHTGLHTVSLPAGQISFTVYLSPFANRFDTKPVVHKRPNSAVSLTHGSLLFAHTLHGVYRPRRPANYQLPGEAPPEANDWTITPRVQNGMPTNDDRDESGEKPPTLIPWNIAIDPSTAHVHEYGNMYSDPDCGRWHSEEHSTTRPEQCNDDWPNPIWSEFAPPVTISVMACEIAWNMTAPVQYEEDDSQTAAANRSNTAESYQYLSPNPPYSKDGAEESVWASSDPVPMTDNIDSEFGSKEHKRRPQAVRGGYPLPPPSPDPKTGRNKCIGRAFPVELRPYGSAKIRMAEFPVADLSPGSEDLAGA